VKAGPARALASRLALGLLVSIASACGSDDTPSDSGALPDADAGTDAGAVVLVPPAPPVLTPCPAGFTELGDPARCAPWLSTEREECPPFEARLPGDPGCAPVGPSCPMGDWAEGLPSADVRYVRAGAAAGGDGTMASPHATILEALTGARAGTIVALAKGIYVEAVRVPLGVTLWGACPAETTVRSDDLSLVREGVITIDTTRVVLKSLSVSGNREGIVLREDAEAALEGVVVSEAAQAGISVFPNATLTADHVLVRDTQVVDGFGGGLASAPGATVMLARFAALGCTQAAVSVFGSTLSLESSLLADTLPIPGAGTFGVGLDAFGGADVLVRTSVLEGNTHRALQAYEAGTVVRVEDSVVRDTTERTSDGQEGRGAFVFGTATLALSRVWLSGHRESALIAVDPGTRIEAEDLVIDDTRGTEAGYYGTALALQDGPSAVLRRAWLSDNRGIAVAALGESHLDLEDVVIRQTASETIDGRFGVALHAQSGSTVDGARISIVDSHQAGISGLGAGSRITLSDVLIAATHERECALTTCTGLGIGDGVLSAVDAEISLDGFEIRGSARAGAHVAGGAMDLRRGQIVDNLIGAVIQTPGFDVARISDGVVFLDNDRNLDMSALPLPEPPTGFE